MMRILTVIAIIFSWTSIKKWNCDVKREINNKYSIREYVFLSFWTVQVISFTHDQQINIEKWITCTNQKGRYQNEKKIPFRIERVRVFIFLFLFPFKYDRNQKSVHPQKCNFKLFYLKTCEYFTNFISWKLIILSTKFFQTIFFHLKTLKLKSKHL